eukprot:Amastigsp_a5228_37.p4 type:complete len:137 gc:universal Amastigsp_a5228_37:344-754(+)
MDDGAQDRRLATDTHRGDRALGCAERGACERGRDERLVFAGTSARELAHQVWVRGLARKDPERQRCFHGLGVVVRERGYFARLGARRSEDDGVERNQKPAFPSQHGQGRLGDAERKPDGNGDAPRDEANGRGPRDD